MTIEVKLPQLGESIAEGTIVRWLKRPGDPVERDEPLLEISTDKVDTEIPSPASAQVESILVSEGETVPVGTVVCVLRETVGAAATATAGASPEAAPGPPRATSGAAPAPGGAAPAPGGAAPAPGRPPARAEPGEPRLPAAPGPRLSPAVRRLVEEHGIDVSRLGGTGEGGRLTRRDVLEYLARHEESARPSTEARRELLEEPPPLEDRVEPMSAMRQAIARHMVESRRAAAHVSTVHEADMGHVAALRSVLQARREIDGVKVTYLPFVVQAAARTLREFPLLNASVLAGGKIHYRGEIHVGVAIALDDGLIVPVVRHADRRTVLDIARTVADLASRARSKRLEPEEVQGGTFTITNPGAFGSLIGTPILHQPQTGILCLGAVTKRPVVVGPQDAIAIRPMAYLTLTFDHRLVDGAVADRFLEALRGRLEEGSFALE